MSITSLIAILPNLASTTCADGFNRLTRPRIRLRVSLLTLSVLFRMMVLANSLKGKAVVRDNSNISGTVLKGGTYIWSTIRSVTVLSSSGSTPSLPQRSVMKSVVEKLWKKLNESITVTRVSSLTSFCRPPSSALIVVTGQQGADHVVTDGYHGIHLLDNPLILVLSIHHSFL